MNLKIPQFKPFGFLVRTFGQFILLAAICGCAAGHCRGRPAEPKTIFVYKLDGSKQCQKNTAISLEEMAKQLGGIEIKSQVNKSDGKMRMTMCGAPTGKINVYQIKESDMEVAKSAGFATWVEPEKK